MNRRSPEIFRAMFEEILDRACACARVEQHQQAEPRVCPAVEDIAEDRQREVTQLLRRGIVPQQRQRKEEKDEEIGGKDHDDLVIPKLNVFD